MKDSIYFVVSEAVIMMLAIAVVVKDNAVNGGDFGLPIRGVCTRWVLKLHVSHNPSAETLLRALTLWWISQ
ncbi:hypothetical protein LJ051_26960 (plasmid) [Escherichia coli]|nr:hypothetical protein LJ051_26960 [Escherichia coli]